MKNIKVIWKIYETDLLGNRKLVKHCKYFNTIVDAIKFSLELRDNTDTEYIEIRFN